MSKVRLKGPENSSFTYGGVSYEADENGFIEVPVGDAVIHAYSHHFAATTEKPAVKTLAKATDDSVKAEPKGAKAAKGGEADEPEADSETVKPIQKGAKAAKGGEQ